MRPKGTGSARGEADPSFSWAGLGEVVRPHSTTRQCEEASFGICCGPLPADSLANVGSEMDYETQNNVTVLVPRGVHTCVSKIERQENCDELLAPAEEDNPEAGPSEEENPHEGSRGLGQNGDPKEQEVIVSKSRSQE